MGKTGFSVVAGRQVRELEETHRTAPPINFALVIEVLGAITFAVILLALYGCDGEFERLQAEAEWHAKVARAALPRDGELVTIKRLSEKSYAVRHYKGGLRHTDILVMEAE